MLWRLVWAMASKALRRRLHHGDVDGRSREHYEASSLDSLNEPLLGRYDNEDEPKEVKKLFLLPYFC